MSDVEADNLYLTQYKTTTCVYAVSTNEIQFKADNKKKPLRKEPDVYYKWDNGIWVYYDGKVSNFWDGIPNELRPEPGMKMVLWYENLMTLGISGCYTSYIYNGCGFVQTFDDIGNVHYIKQNKVFKNNAPEIFFMIKQRDINPSCVDYYKLYKDIKLRSCLPGKYEIIYWENKVKNVIVVDLLFIPSLYANIHPEYYPTNEIPQKISFNVSLTNAKQTYIYDHNFIEISKDNTLLSFHDLLKRTSS